MKRTITTGFMSTSMGDFAITKTVEDISLDDYESMCLSNRDIMSSIDTIKELFFDNSKEQLFRVIK